MNIRTILEIDHERRDADGFGELTLQELRALAENAHVRGSLEEGRPVEICPGVRAVALRRDGEGLTVRMRRGALVRDFTEPETPRGANVRAHSDDWATT